MKNTSWIIVILCSALRGMTDDEPITKESVTAYIKTNIHEQHICGNPFSVYAYTEFKKSFHNPEYGINNFVAKQTLGFLLDDRGRVKKEIRDLFGAEAFPIKSDR